MQVLLHAVVTRVLLVDFDDYDEAQEERAAGEQTAAAAEGARLEVMTDLAVQDNSLGSSDDRARIVDKSPADAKADWRRIAVVVDRACFALFAVIMIVTCLAFTGYL